MLFRWQIEINFVKLEKFAEEIFYDYDLIGYGSLPGMKRYRLWIYMQSFLFGNIIKDALKRVYGGSKNVVGLVVSYQIYGNTVHES